MKILMAIKHVFKTLPLAASLSPLMVLAVVGAEGVQHIAEYNLGMYQSQAVFHGLQNNPVRLGFGAFKAIAMITACYVIAKKLAHKQGPLPKNGSFRAGMIRRLWDPRLGMTGLIVALLLAAPLIILHYKLSYLAMGHSAAPLILALDSALIGFLALIIGTSIWAGDVVEGEARPSA